MIKLPEFDIFGFVRQYLPPVLRKDKLLAFLNALVYSIHILWIKFKEWTAEQDYLLNISPTVIHLQNFLNDLYDPVHRRILILTRNVDALYLPLESEAYTPEYFALESENEPTYILLYGEIVSNYGSFIVIVPNDINSEKVRQTIDKYKLVGKKHTIQIQN